jgi:NCS1 family nucleobase:cation symporter-1
MNHLRRVGAGVVASLKIQEADGNLANKNSGRVWSNQDMDPVALERRNWSSWTFGAYWIAEAWAPNTWSVGASLVAGGLLWWHALLACIVGHLLASILTVWNGRGGAVYHIGVCSIPSSFFRTKLTKMQNSFPSGCVLPLECGDLFSPLP